MHSPLPDSSALEAGILEDERPTRLSRIQDNVRNLLRASVFSSVRGSTVVQSANDLPQVHHDQNSLPRTSVHVHIIAQPEVLPSPSSESTMSTTTTSTSTEEQHHVSGVLFPATQYPQDPEAVAHQSSLYNTRAVAALNHPDLSDPSMALFLQQKTERRQRRAWKRSRNRKMRHTSVRGGSSQWLLCFISLLLLIAIVGTYVILATTSSDVSTTFHILFVLGILLATVLFAHTLIRICLRRRADIPGSPTVYVTSDSRTKRRPRRHGGNHHHNHGHHHHEPRDQPTLSEGVGDFVPPTPIPVHVAADEVRPDSREAQPSAAVEPTPAEWDKDLNDLPNPPPAYGRWRGSVRADPDLLHWQAVPSPVDPDTPSLPSPTYEEAVNESRTGPPSYVTRESPARRRDVQEATPELARAQVAEPEMFEVRGIGLGV